MQPSQEQLISQYGVCGSVDRQPPGRSQVPPQERSWPPRKVYKAFTLDQTIISVPDFTEVRGVLHVAPPPRKKSGAPHIREIVKCGFLDVSTMLRF